MGKRGPGRPSSSTNKYLSFGEKLLIDGGPDPRDNGLFCMVHEPGPAAPPVSWTRPVLLRMLLVHVMPLTCDVISDACT